MSWEHSTTMDIINYVRIENFRSIRLLTMSELDSYSPLVGLNSSGKSNVLRALNLFFNGHVDEDQTPLDLAVDYSTHAPKGKKKTISVTVGIALTGEMRVRGVEEFQDTYGITDVVYIRRMWSLGTDKISIVDRFAFGATPERLQDADAADATTLQAYIRAIRYVYVPNHTRPADLIRSELAPLRPTLIARLRATKAYRESNVSELIAELGKMGDRMFGDVSHSVERGLPATSIAANLPDDFADLIFTLGVSAVSDAGVAREPDYEGSGAQSFILLHILDLADRTRRGSGFGWVQASVWAVEEPESFLHAGLRAQFSSDLSSYSADTRRQVLVTTHQDEFVRVSERVWTATRTPDGTTVTPSTARIALEETARREITTYRHPLFTYTDRPLVIVEGKHDGVHLRTGIERAGRHTRWRLVTPDEIFEPDTGGDALYEYLRYNKQVLASRPDAAPVIVLRDWEDTKKNKYDRVLASHPYSTCKIADSTLANPQLGESFVGIERFLSTDLIESHIPEKHLGLEHRGENAPYAINRRHLESAKSALGAAVEAGANPGPHMVRLAEWLDDEVEAIIATMPPGIFL